MELTGEWAQPNAALKLTTKFADDADYAHHMRDEAIVWARKYGATLRQIADAANMTPQGVRKIIAKRLDNSVHTGTMDT